ncbi:hypothetical protein [Microcoleus sp. AT13-A5]|uniref:hypothetical protein n=1 Tax=Microcoleus sp. AT13-A5 TaxID=2818590 RepID=UPI002FD2FC34
MVKHATFDFTFYLMAEVSGRSGDWVVGDWGNWGMGHGAWGMGHGAWGMGHGAWGMGHGELVVNNQ